MAKRIAWLSPLLVGLLLALPAAAFLAAQAHRRAAREPLPAIATLPAFTLTDQSGRPFGSADLAGRPTVVDFVFTRCASLCPLLTERMHALEHWTTAHGLGAVQLASITVDPTGDTPERLAEYARTHAIAAPRWRLLTGPSEAVERVVVRGFFEAMGKPERDGSRLEVLHSSRLVLVDGALRIRGYYESDADGLERLERDLARLASEDSP
jgi:protein SCO1/2